MGDSVLCTQYHCPWLVLSNTIHLQAGRGHPRESSVTIGIKTKEVPCSLRSDAWASLGSGPYWLSWDAHW